MKSSDIERLLDLQVSRRAFIGGLSSLAGLALAARYSNIAFAQSAFQKTPFSLGVASGDPTPTGVVLWTRLAPDPLHGGGMQGRDVPVRWQIASDENMKKIVQKGTSTATAALGHSVHVEVEGLQPGRHYWYRFETGDDASPVGRTRTAPAFNSNPDQLRFAFASCQSWPAGYYAAYRHMAKQDLDFVVHLGDYIYEARIRPRNAVRTEDVPAEVRPEPMTLEQYRLRYSLYKLDPDLQAAHAAFPFIVTWDDHEVENNYAAQYDQNGSKPEEFLLRRAAAYQAYYEHMPLRRTSMPHGPDLQLYRRLTFGNLAQFNILDTRQYRSDQADGDKGGPRTPELMDPSRGLMGKTQEKWLHDGLSQSSARWNVIAQQVIMAQRSRLNANGEEVFGRDGWDGYPAERNRLMNFLNERKPSNPIVLAGDSHTNLVSDLLQDFAKADSPIVASEFAGTAITSGGMNPAGDAARQKELARHPHQKWFEGIKRGYVQCKLDRNQWHTDFMSVDDAKKADSPVRVISSWVVENSKPGVQRV